MLCLVRLFLSVLWQMMEGNYFCLAQSPSQHGLVWCSRSVKSFSSNRGILRPVVRTRSAPRGLKPGADLFFLILSKIILIFIFLKNHRIPMRIKINKTWKGIITKFKIYTLHNTLAVLWWSFTIALKICSFPSCRGHAEGRNWTLFYFVCPVPLHKVHSLWTWALELDSLLFLTLSGSLGRLYHLSVPPHLHL